jgi:hypothetical protein
MESTATAQTNKWGLWSFDPALLSLTLKKEGVGPYSIALRDIKSSACMLDFIFEIRGKRWATNEVIGDLITAFQDLFDPQVTLCTGRADKDFDPVVHFDGRAKS